MEEEEEDRILLCSLGVTSANPEDIEHHILTEVKKDAGERNEAEGSNLEHHDGIEDSKSSSSDLSKLYNKLRAVEFEIEAVAASGEQAKSIKRNEQNDSDEIDDREGEDAGEIKSDAQASANDLTLQYALTADRLNSLKKTRVRLLKEIEELDKNNSTKGSQDGKLISDLVKEERRLKRKLKEDQSSSKNSKKQRKKVTINEDDEFDAVLDAASAGFVETERDELVRKGILTPFHKLKGFERRVQQPGPSSRHYMTEEEAKAENLASISVAKAVRSFSEAAQARSTTKLLEANALPKLDAPTRPFQRLKMPVKLLQSTMSEKIKAKRTKKKRPLPGKRWRKVLNEEEKFIEEEDAGDGTLMSDDEEENQDDEDVDDNESHFVVLEGGLKIPEIIFSKLFDYQKVGVQWMWELHCQRAGGIIGDEMGLGKTIQVLSFLGALHFSKMYKPSIVVCPVTLLRQWRREAHKWYPSFHVEILHDSAQVAANRKRADLDASDDESEGSLDSDDGRTPPSKTTKRWDSLINRVLRSESGLLITTYEQIRILGDKLLDIQWGYAILDEGHRIRNPNAEVTLVCKQLQTVHRIIMTGAPIQNKLSELWSLFDFVFPGKLGVLPVFEAEFAVPISVGGYANATPLQVSTAYRCAVVLRDLIMPYLLRRMKADVNAQLPKKTEHVLFCSLTAEQRAVYRAFLASSEVEQIFDGSKNSLYGIDIMRKICNHPDLLERDHASSNPDYGNPDRSGKMKVVAQVLRLWKDQGHRVLLFAQTQQMLDILENFLIANGYTYRRMDGLTPVKQRTALMDEFNDSNDIFIFILTTKVGGLGTNLTGGNRVIIFDPDWNPSTDMQARERAWRIGQTRDVTIYRLITRGTIEEKVYHRQIYKHFLTNKILKNPQQKRFFKSRDMKDLFTLDDGEGGSTETSNIFKQLSDEANILEGHKDDQDKQGTINATETCTSTSAVERETKPAPGSSRRSGKERADQSDGDTDQETDILKSLFHAHGIHSAMNHDVLMNAHDDEKMRLEEQASQVAQRAAEALRQSRMLRSQDGISVPTWTGRSGAAGAPSSVRKKFGSTLNSQLIGNSKSSGGSTGSGMNRPNGFAAGASVGKALSSADLLAKMRGTQERAVSDGLEHQFLSSSRSTVRTQPNADVGPSRTTHKAGLQPEVLIRQICTFIQQRGGRSSSATLVQHFKDRIPSTDLALFKNLLKEIAFLEKDHDGSSWVLKPEYL